MTNRPARILFVEDEIAFSSLVSMTLREDHGHQVDLAETGEDAIERLRGNEYDLVFLDFVTDQTENVYPMIPGGKGITEMILAEDL